MSERTREPLELTAERVRLSHRSTKLSGAWTRSSSAGAAWATLLLAIATLACHQVGPDSKPAGAEPAADTTGLEASSRSEAEQLLERSIAFHDPGDAWSEASLALRLEESRPNGTVRKTRLEFHNQDQVLELSSENEGRTSAFRVQGEEVVWTRLDGRDEISDDEREEFRLSPARVLRTRNYYTYLYGLPMKLRDRGTRIDPEVAATEYDGREALEIRVTYDPDVGGDIWKFYFDPRSSELIGYRFYHDETIGDGEYILLEGLAEVAGMRLPRARTWFTHLGDELLGTDTVVDS